MTAPALRPYLPADAPVLAAIFREAVEELTIDEYDDEQRAAWAAAADDVEAFARRLASMLTLVAVEKGRPVAFASLEDNEMIAMLYVHPDVAGRGFAAALADALEKLAFARGAKQVTTDASDVSRGFFQHRGYTPTQRNSVMRAGQWLANTTMVKRLTAPAGRLQ
ncbi:MAG: GNAT family N-acetyltransferase [Methylobacteriaceae bacterium]|nr:GNAT family N-acetyltransferase [Methylobacteriaceae bacterium]